MYQRPRLPSQLVHGTKLSEFIAEEASGSEELHNEAQEVFHFDEGIKAGQMVLINF